MVKTRTNWVLETPVNHDLFLFYHQDYANWMVQVFALAEQGGMLRHHQPAGGFESVVDVLADTQNR
jgi:hypothetical protein